MKGGATLSVKVGIVLVVGCTSYLVIHDLFGRSIAVSFAKWGWLAFAVFLTVHTVFDIFEAGEYRAKVRKRTIRKMDKKIRNLDYLTAENAVGFFALDARTGESKAEFQARSPRSITVNGRAEPGRMEGPPVPALDLLDPSECLVLAGGRGSGKTTLAFHAVARRLARGEQALIIDPKPGPREKWFGAPVVGQDHRYEDIVAALRFVNEGMRRNGRRLTVVIDEIAILNERIPRFSSEWIGLLMEGREYLVGLWILTQSATAGSLGLSGRFDLTSSFDHIATCRKNRITGERSVLIETDGEPEIVANHPGPFDSPSGNKRGGANPWPTGPGPDVPDAEWTEGPDAEPKPDAGLKRKVSGLLGYFRRPDLSEARAEIWEALYRNGRPLTPKTLSEVTGKKPGTVRKLLHGMAKAGEVERRGRGRYSIPGV